MKTNRKYGGASFQKAYRRLLFQVIFTVAIYTLSGFMVYLLCVNLLSHYAGENAFLLQVLMSINHNGWIGTLIYIVIGYGAILLYYWNKPFQYLNEILYSSENIFMHKEDSVELSPALKDAEVYLNRLRESMNNNERIIQEAEQRKMDFIAYLAHDLRTPLTSVIGYLSLLKEATDMSIEQKAKYINIACDKAQRMERLLNEFFEITRYDLKSITLERETIDLYYMLIQITDEFYPLMSAHDNTIRLIADENASVCGDSDKLARVFCNLIKNAITYSYSGTEIVIEVKMFDTSVRISFSNHGKTIPSSKLDSIFDRFFRLDDTRATDTGGAGLGLAIAKEIISLHKGSIYATSDNEVTTFYVNLYVSG